MRDSTILRSSSFLSSDTPRERERKRERQGEGGRGRERESRTSPVPKYNLIIRNMENPSLDF